MKSQPSQLQLKSVDTERRKERRQRTYLSDAIGVEVTTHEGLLKGWLFDVGNEGLGVGIPVDQCAFEPGLEAEIEIAVAARAGRPSWQLRGRVRNSRIVRTDSGTFRHLGIETLGSAASELARKRLAGFHSHVVPPLLRPIAFASDPLFFGETLHFQVVEIRSRGLVAYTSLRNKSLFPGECLDLTVMLPISGEFRVDAQVVDAKALTGEDDVLRVELAFEEQQPELLAALGEFVLSFSPDATLESLRRQGFFIDTIFNAIRLGYPTGDADWRAILELRLDAYHSVGKCMDKVNPEDMRDPFDAFSRHIVARVGGRVVGAARVVFVGKDLARSEHQALGITVPKEIVEQGFLEFSRFCSAPEFRGADVFIALMRQATMIAARSGMGFIVANCNSDLWNVYRKIGFRKVSKPFEAFGRKDCVLIAGDIQSTVFRGRHSSLALWSQTVLPVQEFVAEREGRFLGGAWHPWVALQKAVVEPVVDVLRRKRRFKAFQERPKSSKGKR